ncbi:LysR family transcriptional regulator [Raoultibacter phocaeensis]|uniref:LysR family transcriptional regulator n=1 Tax=Raoultibacter phocaeensis TaxID=2479841 RepID=UPI00111BC17E|nr:LysR family transcriptional regulator [Raoultibacter phocaeensis]
MAQFRMDVDQRRYFCTLCSTGNITQAAQTLFISRQGLSKSMKALESHVGAQLFERGKNGVTLTEAGRVLLRYIREDDRLWDACMADIREASEAEPVSIRIGLLSMYVGYEQKRELFASFQDDADIRIEVVDGDHDAFWQAIAAGEMDFAFTISPPDDMGLPTIKLANDTLAVLLSVNDPLAKKACIDFKADLRGKTVIQTSPYKGRLYETAFKNHGIETELLLHDRNLMLARVSTSEDCFIIQTQYAKDLVTDQVCMRPLVNAPIEMDSTFVFRADLNDAARAVALKLLEASGKQDELDAYFAEHKPMGGKSAARSGQA